MPEILAPEDISRTATSLEVLAEHFAGRIGGAIERSLTGNDESRADLDQLASTIGELVDRLVDEHDLERQVVAFAGETADDGAVRLRAYASGAFHGLVEVLRLVRGEISTGSLDATAEDEASETALLSEGDDESVHGGSDYDDEVPERCARVAQLLLAFRFERIEIELEAPTPAVEGVDDSVVDVYFEGARVAMQGISSTVKSLLRRRLVSVVDQIDESQSTEVMRDRERLAVLLFVALTNYPRTRVVGSLGEEYRGMLDEEVRLNHVFSRGQSQNPALGVTDEGGREIRDLLLTGAGSPS